MKNLFKNENGITLIALIITIIVLIILAGITVGSLVTNNSVLNQSQNAKNETLLSEELEKVNLAISDAAIAVGETETGSLTTESVKNGIKGQFGEAAVSKVTGEGPWTYEGKYKTYKIFKNGSTKGYKTVAPTDVYVALCNNTLVFSNNEADINKYITDNSITGSPTIQNITDTVFTDTAYPQWVGNFDIEYVKFLNIIAPKNTAYWFYDLESLKEIQDIKNLKTSNVTSMASMFNACISIESLDLSEFDTTKVTDMSAMLCGTCYSMKKIDVSSFDTSNVTDMSYMFYLIDDMFDNEFETIIGLENFNTAKVKNMSKMFDGCNKIKTLDLSSFDVTNTEDVSDMFSGCNALKTIYAQNWDLTKASNTIVSTIRIN